MKAVIALLCLLAAQVFTKELPSVSDETQDVAGGYEKDQPEDPCMNKVCGPGRECDLNEDNQPICVCMHSCGEEDEEGELVCSTTNVTFTSECDLYRQKCVCEKKLSGCRDLGFTHVKLDYFGQCKEQTPCDEWELEEFPKRLRHWFYLVMEELAGRDELNMGSKRRFQEDSDEAKRLLLPVIWQFCQLDISRDRLVDYDEMLAMSASLKTQEHCMTPFLKQCDVNNDESISLQEWGRCLRLDPAEVEDKCEELWE